MSERANITSEMIDHLKAEIDRAGIGAYKLLRSRSDVPEGLTNNVVESWLDGRVRTARRDHYDYVLACFREVEPYVAITPAIRDELRAHRERTGIGPAVLLNAASNMPDGLTVGMVESWLSGICKKTREECLEFVLARYEAWSSKGPDGQKHFPAEQNK